MKFSAAFVFSSAQSSKRLGSNVIEGKQSSLLAKPLLSGQVGKPFEENQVRNSVGGGRVCKPVVTGSKIFAEKVGI